MPLLKYKLKKYKNRSERLTYYNYINRQLKSYKNGIPLMCLKRKGNEWYILDNENPIFKVIFSLGKGKKYSADAEAKALCFPLIKKNKKFACDLSKKIQLAVKVIPLQEDEFKNAYFFEKNKPDKKSLKYNTWKELYILQKCSSLIINKKAYNLPLIYGFFICLDADKKDYSNINIRKNYEKRNLTNKNLLILNELNDYDLRMYINEKRFKGTNLIITILQQVLLGLYNLKHNLNCIHFDLHLGNILVSLTDENGFYEYKINKKSYYIEQNKILIKLWDFGRSILLKEEGGENFIKSIINHHKYYFTELTKKQIKMIGKNLMNKKYRNLLYSIDIWRFFMIFDKLLLKNKYIIKNDVLDKIFNKIIIMAENDITKKLYSKKYKKPSITIEYLVKLFLETKRPEKIIDTFTIQ